MRIKIKIKLLGISKPEVWRIFWIPMGISFDTLHHYIQAVMGWENSHLYEFKEKDDSIYFNIISPYFDDNPGINASTVLVDNILFGYLNSSDFMNENNRDKLLYVYDIGDYWLHELEIIDFDGSINNTAEILDCNGACPPENSGGPDGYQRMKNYIDGKIKPEVYYDWYSAQNAEGFDINKFDLAKADTRMKKVKNKKTKYS